MIRRILHIDMDAFFVAVERVLDPSLKGRPVIVGGDPNGRGVVAAASYEARRYGVRSAMPMARARRLCPHAVFIRGRHHLYAQVAERVLEVLRRYSPVVEPLSIDEAYVDLTGCERLHGPAMPAAERIREDILREVGISASIGISTSRLVSKVASKMAKPAGILEVRPGHEAAFLAPLPVEVLPGVGPRTSQTLRLLHITTVGDLANADPFLLRGALGQMGRILALRARGVDAAPVEPESAPPRSIGREVTFQRDTLERRQLAAALWRLSEQVGRALRRRGLRAWRVQMKLRYSDFVTITRWASLAEPTDMDHEIFAHAHTLMERALERRVRVRLLGVGVSGLTSEPWQLPLFGGRQAVRRCALYRALDRVRERHGTEALRVGRVLVLG